MAKYRISCVHKSDRFNPHERIRSVGGVDRFGQRWLFSQEQAVSGIDTGQLSFDVVANGKEVEVIVARSRWGHRYLKTKNDGEQPNNLLSLSECPL